MSDLLSEVRAIRLPPPAACKAIRLASGITQGEVAKELGVTRFTVLRWELGYKRPSRRLARRYARLLDALRREVVGDVV